MSNERSNHFCDCRGIPVSYKSDQAIEALENVHELYLAFRGDPLAEIEQIIEQHPNFILAHLFKAAYLTQVLESRVHDDLHGAVSKVEALCDYANERELLHLNALRAWLNGEVFHAIGIWEEALVKYPYDLLALQIIHLSYVLFGEVKGQRDVVAKVYTRWREDTPGFEHVLGFYAFGLEENGDFERAEELARRSLSIQPENPYAVHAIAHVMDMQGRYKEGLIFMYEEAERWTESGFDIHLWWHTALMHLDLQQFDRVLEIYDEQLRKTPDASDRYEEFDATALLWRLNLLSVDVGDRWIELANKWEPSAQDTLYAFNNIHAMMALVSAERYSAVQALLAANERYVEHATNDNAVAIETVGIPFCKAIEYFHAGRYTDCTAKLLPVRRHLDQIGGSFVQREILDWTSLEAALRSHQYALAVALANERCELKPGSAQRWLDLGRGLEGINDLNAAASAQETARRIITETAET